MVAMDNVRADFLKFPGNIPTMPKHFTNGSWIGGIVIDVYWQPGIMDHLKKFSPIVKAHNMRLEHFSIQSLGDIQKRFPTARSIKIGNRKQNFYFFHLNRVNA